jgi:hypothetical protein
MYLDVKILDDSEIPDDLEAPTVYTEQAAMRTIKMMTQKRDEYTKNGDESSAQFLEKAIGREQKRLEFIKNGGIIPIRIREDRKLTDREQSAHDTLISEIQMRKKTCEVVGNQSERLLHDLILKDAKCEITGAEKNLLIKSILEHPPKNDKMSDDE